MALPERHLRQRDPCVMLHTAGLTDTDGHHRRTGWVLAWTQAYPPTGGTFGRCAVIGIGDERIYSLACATFAFGYIAANAPGSCSAHCWANAGVVAIIDSTAAVLRTPRLVILLLLHETINVENSHLLKPGQSQTQTCFMIEYERAWILSPHRAMRSDLEGA